ncbi:MAG: hypothetical protein NC086_04290 [Alistipes sp.]|nr:hypothetical protein [Alistipes sp.]
MGRPGRTSGGGGMRSGSSHSSSRSHSSSSFSSSSRPNRPSGNFNNFGPGPQSNHGPGPNFGPGGPYYAPHPPRPPRTHIYYSGGARPRGCLDSILSYMVTLIIICVILAFIYGSMRTSNSSYGNQYGSNTIEGIDEDVVFKKAQKYYSENFGNDENYVLLYYAYLEKSEEDTAIMIIGDEAVKVFDDNMQDRFWDIYDGYYYDNEKYSDAEWLGYSFRDIAYEMRNSISNDKPFNRRCWEDKLEWIKMADENKLVDGLRAFYDASGIQAWVVLVDYSTLLDDVVEREKTKRIGIIAIAVIIIVIIFFIWWKKKQKRKKEEADQQERILNTPLEKFGTSEVDDLMNKYDDN